MAGKADPKLTDESRTYVVQALACFDPPSVVAAAVRRDFKITITSQSVERYDPTKHAGRKLIEKWKTLFHATREEFIKDSSKVGISHRSVRLRALHRMAERAESNGNLALAAQLHEQAAKEVGESYTNRQKLEHTGKDGTALPPAAVNVYMPSNGREPQKAPGG